MHSRHTNCEGSFFLNIFLRWFITTSFYDQITKKKNLRTFLYFFIVGDMFLGPQSLKSYYNFDFKRFTGRHHNVFRFLTMEKRKEKKNANIHNCPPKNIPVWFGHKTRNPIAKCAPNTMQNLVHNLHDKLVLDLAKTLMLNLEILNSPLL